MTKKTKRDDEMRSHYDFSGGERGKYAARYAEGTNVVVRAREVTEVFHDHITAKDALRPPLRPSTKSVTVQAAPKKRLK